MDGHDDPVAGRRADMARNGLYRHAEGLSVAGFAGSGDLASRPLGGHLFCFRSRRGNLLKMIWHDDQRAFLFTKHLERGRFIWPSPDEGVVTISSAQLGYLLSGIDWRHPQETWRPTSVGCGFELADRDGCGSIIDVTTSESLPTDLAVANAMILVERAARLEREFTRLRQELIGVFNRKASISAAIECLHAPRAIVEFELMYRLVRNQTFGRKRERVALQPKIELDFQPE